MNCGTRWTDAGFYPVLTGGLIKAWLLVRRFHPRRPSLRAARCIEDALAVLIGAPDAYQQACIVLRSRARRAPGPRVGITRRRIVERRGGTCSQLRQAQRRPPQRWPEGQSIAAQQLDLFGSVQSSSAHAGLGAPGFAHASIPANPLSPHRPSRCGCSLWRLEASFAGPTTYTANLAIDGPVARRGPLAGNRRGILSCGC